MKIIQITLIILWPFFHGFDLFAQKLNNFSAKQDTLVLKTEKMKGCGLFEGMARQIHFNDTIEFYKYSEMFPPNITNVRLAYHIIDFKRFNYDDFRRKDKWNDSLIKINSICIMSGLRNNDKIFIVDENNNKDFRDDSIRLYRKMDWKSTSKLIKCKYKIYNGKEMVVDSSWTNIGTINDNELLFFVSNHLESTFSIDDQIYEVGLADVQSNFSFDEPILALTSQNGIKKDTLLEMELLKKEEYLKFKDSYYRFANIANDGKYITLIKDKDFNSKIGTQVGMIAPDFSCLSMDGDTISFKDYKGKYLLFINVSACFSKISSYKCYKDLTDTYKGKVEFIGLDNSPAILENNIKELMLPGKFVIAEENKMIQKTFRPNYCSRTCYLINPEGRIVDKFEIFDWKSNLARVFENEK